MEEGRESRVGGREVYNSPVASCLPSLGALSQGVWTQCKAAASEP